MKTYRYSVCSDFTIFGKLFLKGDVLHIQGSDAVNNSQRIMLELFPFSSLLIVFDSERNFLGTLSEADRSKIITAELIELQKEETEDDLPF